MNYSAADLRFLKKTASILLSAVRFRSPTDKSAASWHVDTSKTDGAKITTRDIGTIATNQPRPLGQRHPVFGNRDVWRENNKYHPERTDFVGQAIREVADRAAEDGLDEWLKGVAIESRYFSYRGQ